MGKKTKVLIVDDSAVVRQTLESVLNEATDLEVVATAGDPYIAARKISKQVPDVILLDVEMPRMDGITFLRKIMAQHPIPVVICSSLTDKGTETTLKALQFGAVDIIHKPKLGARQFFEESKVQICDAVRAASLARLAKLSHRDDVSPKLTADAVLSANFKPKSIGKTDRVVVVGASTGGTEALRVLLEGLPAHAPGMVIVQHMPENFTAAFASRLDSICQVSVREASNGAPIEPGCVLIAPGNRHALLKRNGNQYYAEVKDGPLVCRHRPSVDVLFRSAARYAGSNAVGIIMTGMGDDGARGLLELRQSGAHTIAQDEKTSVVFGMPNEAIKSGAVCEVLPLDAIGPAALKACSRS
ncbi:MAG: chemotaxis response regulator protein-glutamate methylesterase [Desulfuromonadales bacterium]|nr:chemotaxis response regulator protein-glutamate methylesterase [Desulfuromonadales bacterium]NIR34047.1 chemotaxis response regulator protein-glutamate methylesterase [Desulfuromonadales bacterium]NIS44098.1 chemotaxis response regulator protein-glutamate methylesterase [Desulfuromonadales bacterium]